MHASNCQGSPEDVPEVVTIPDDDDERRENSKVDKSDVELLDYFEEKQSLKTISDFDTSMGMGKVFTCKICQQEFRHLRKFKNHCLEAHSKGIKRIHDYESSDYSKGTNNSIMKKSKSNSRIKLSEKIDNILNDSEKTHFQESEEPSLYSGHFMSFENQFCEFCEKTFPNMILFEEHKNNFHKISKKTQIDQEIAKKSIQNATFQETEPNLQYQIDPSWYSGHFMSGLIFESPGPISGTIPDDDEPTTSSKRRENSNVDKSNYELLDYFEDLEEIPDFDVANEGSENENENDFDEDVIVLED